MKWPDYLTVLRHVLLYLCTLGIGWLMAGFMPVLAMILLTMAVVALSSLLKQKNAALRFLPLLLWGFLFLPLFSEVGFVSRTIPVIYTAARIISGIDRMTYDQSRTELFAGCALYAVVALFSSLENAADFFAVTLPCFLAWAALATFQLRLLKNPELQNDRQYLLFSGGISLLMLVIIQVMTSQTFANALKALIRFIYEKILLTPILLMIQGIAWLLQQFFTLLSSIGFSEIHFENDFESVFEEIGSYNEHYEFNYTHGGDLTWLMILTRVIAVLIVILITWLIIRRMRKRRSRTESGLSFTKERSIPHCSSEKDHNPSSRIRTLYRKYLRLASRYQIDTDGRDASDVVAAKTDAMLNSKDASKLRRLWLPVRYGHGSDQEAAEAERLYKSIKKQFRDL